MCFWDQISWKPGPKKQIFRDYSLLFQYRSWGEQFRHKSSNSPVWYSIWMLGQQSSLLVATTSIFRYIPPHFPARLHNRKQYTHGPYHWNPLTWLQYPQYCCYGSCIRTGVTPQTESPTASWPDQKAASAICNRSARRYHFLYTIPYTLTTLAALSDPSGPQNQFILLVHCL